VLCPGQCCLLHRGRTCKQPVTFRHVTGETFVLKYRRDYSDILFGFPEIKSSSTSFMRTWRFDWQSECHRKESSFSYDFTLFNARFLSQTRNSQCDLYRCKPFHPIDPLFIAERITYLLLGSSSHVPPGGSYLPVRHKVV
jgi:hypothetical protein